MPVTCVPHPWHVRVVGFSAAAVCGWGALGTGGQSAVGASAG
ncbi:MAG: hypothetical protein ABI847_08455 [Anaerolineales bacterium]